MINVLNMTKTGVIDDLFEFNFDFEFDNASTLPTKFVVIEQQKYLIANDSTAKNLSTNTYYKYNSVDVCWVRSLAKTPTPTPKDNTQITENGNYNIINNSFTGYNDISVNVEGPGGDVTLIEKTVTENGEYSASDDAADGYSKVTVEVPNTYTNEDEGKVVDNGALVAQTAYPTEITENDTYDTTNYNSITVNVSGGSSSVVAICTFDFSKYQFSLEDESGTIGERAFMNCSTLTSITISNNVTSIGESAFYNCSSLTSITIPNSVTYIGETAFGDCGSLETVTFEQNSSLDNIGNGAFMNCSTLTSITIPNSVTYIWGSAFEYCTALETMTFEPTTPPKLSADLGLPANCVIRVPQGTLSAYTSASNYPNPSQYTYEEY